MIAILLLAAVSVGCPENESGGSGGEAPASVDGLRYDVTVTSSTGSLFTGTFRITFSGGGGKYLIDGDGTIPNSSGTFTYAASGAVGTITANDVGMGNPTVIVLTFTTASSSGTMELTSPSGNQSGTFVLGPP
jgi:hypothetical protein